MSMSADFWVFNVLSPAATEILVLKPSGLRALDIWTEYIGYVSYWFQCFFLLWPLEHFIYSRLLITMSSSEQASTLAEDMSVKKETELTSQTDNSNVNAGSNDLDTEKAQFKPPGSGPDGGAAAWLVVFGAWCTSFCSFGWLNSNNPYQMISKL